LLEKPANMGASSTRMGQNPDHDAAAARVVCIAFLRGLFEGFSGPALMAVRPDLSHVKGWIDKRESRRLLSDAPRYEDALELTLRKICKEVLLTADQAVKQHGFGYTKVVEKRLDEDGKLRQKERITIEGVIRSNNGEER
jgi:hypothetical protein